jgi:DNA polymerase III subunit delta'
MGFSAIEAQDAPLAVLRRALEQQRIGQAYLLWGPSGVGKQLAAMALAKAALCPEQPGEGCDRCEVCRRIGQGTHPDVRVFAPRDEGNRNLPVEFVRSEILPLAKFAPFEAQRSFLIFPEADVSFPVLHPEAANALLKTLEEPKSRVHFVLLSERPDRLLPTIRSRCQRVRFAPLPAQVLMRVLERHGVAAELRAPAVALASGRADRALALASEGRAQQVLQWALEVDAALERPDAAQLLALGERCAASEDRALALESLASLYRDVAAFGLGLPREQLAFGHELAAIEARARQLPPAAAAARVAKVLTLHEDLERNANPEVALQGLLFALSVA